MKLFELHDKIALVCPIIGINSDGIICFKDEATDDQKTQAKAMMDLHYSELELMP
jgi:hypothetical protein